MKFKFNPITGVFDRISDAGDLKEHINPLTGEFNLAPDADSYKQVFNPLTGKRNLALAAFIAEVMGNGYINLTNAVKNKLLELKAYGGTEQHNIPSEYTEVNYVTNSAKTWLDTGVKFDFSKNYEIEIRVRGTSGSWYIFQAREAASAPTHGISGSSTGDTIILGFGGSSINTSQISRITDNIYYIKGTVNNGNLTLYVKDETAGTEETVTGIYTPSTGTSVNIGLFGNGQTGAGGFQGVAPDTNVYYARIKENDTYIIDYVPCKQNTTAGVYDKVSGTFKTTTDLVADGNTVPTPDTPMDIVCNNGVLKVNSQGQIYADGTTETIQVIGKNLFDTQWQSGIYNTTSGAYTPTANRICNVNMIQVKPSTNYTVSCPSYELQNGMRWLFYDKNKNFISALTNGATTITTPSNAKYINFYIANNLTVGTAPDLQLEEGSTATDYEAYYNGGTATAEMLLKVGDYQDVQSIIDGAITRNVGIKVLDGTENWTSYTVTQGTLFRTQIADSASNSKEILGVLCNYYAIVGSSLRTNGTLTGAARNYDFINNDYTTLNTWKQYLATQYANGTPVIIVYPLETPTTESVAGQEMNIQKGNNTIEITEAAIDDLPLSAKYLSI